jgi:hypothetical protein
METRIMSLKKPHTVRGKDAAYLASLSKAALVDVLTEALRLAAGECDTELTAEAVREIVQPTLLRRGDAIPAIHTPYWLTAVVYANGNAAANRFATRQEALAAIPPIEEWETDVAAHVIAHSRTGSVRDERHHSLYPRPGFSAQAVPSPNGVTFHPYRFPPAK